MKRYVKIRSSQGVSVEDLCKEVKDIAKNINDKQLIEKLNNNMVKEFVK